MAKWALVTGASQGIGHEFAKLFAAEGYNLALVSRDAPRLEQIATELRAQHRVEIKVIASDLSRIQAPQEVFDAVQREKIFISVLVNNAGYGVHGPMLNLELQQHLDLLQVNVTSLIQLTHLFARPMMARRDGRILNNASIASFISSPVSGMYYASKAIVHSFSLSLAQELADTGVTVTTVYPGFTRSQFHIRSGVEVPPGWCTMEAGKVARIAYRAMLAGKPMVIPGWYNKLFVFLARHLPIRLMTWMAGRNRRRKAR